MPDNNNVKASASSIGAAIEQTKGFFQQNLAKKYAELEAVVIELETKLSGVLKAGKEEAATIGSTASAILRNDADSPLYNLVQDLKNEGDEFHSRFEYLRNKISGIIDRLHI